ncbi:MAG: aldo/keto reductase [Clostridia bacterium]|nr:aldo/keto reductase [Clostridia bacterium]
MINKRFPGTDITASHLGLGAMRLPKQADGSLDEKEAIALIREAVDGGITYVDTAYPYHDGHSEEVVGRALKDGYRKKVTLVTKLPIWKVESRQDMDQVLEEQLRKLQVDYVDFYLLHAMSADRLEKMRKLDYQRFLEDKIKEGKIRYPGFSFHDKESVFLEILNDYDWKLAQVQMNLLDGEYQATLRGIKAAGEKGVGVVVMEPLRGGALAKATGEVKALYDRYPAKRTPVEWALRYLMEIPEVVNILSGMSTRRQVWENIRIFESVGGQALTDDEKALLDKVKNVYLSRIKTGCTGCAYCQPCPQNVAIPKIFQVYDEARMLDNGKFSKFYQVTCEKEKDASRCIACGQCEGACPQNLPIIRYLKEIHEETLESRQ